MYYTPEEQKTVDTALYVYSKTGPSYEMREKTKELLHIEKKILGDFSKKPLCALSYIAEQTGLELDEECRSISLSRGIEDVIQLHYDDYHIEGKKKFYYHRWYENHRTYLSLNSHDIETVIKIIKMDIERYKNECDKPWFKTYYLSNYAPAWWEE